MKLLNKKRTIQHKLLFTTIIILSFLLIEPIFKFEGIYLKKAVPENVGYINQSGNSDRIFILDNWSAAEAVGICSGLGTYLNPYVIKDKVINGNGSGNGIAIRSRKDYFRIDNCTIFNCEVGIDLYSTDNGTLNNNNCSFNGIGIYLHCPSMPTQESYGCFNNSIFGNIANNNSWQGIYLGWGCEDNLILNNTANNNVEYGINFEGQSDITISGNTASNNRIGIKIIALGNNSELSKNKALNNEDFGIYNYYLSGWILTENIMVGSGLFVQCRPIEEMSQTSIDTTNTVNGGSIYFYINETHLTPSYFANAGQIILDNCTDVLIKDVDVSDSSNGIYICHSNNVVIENCVSSNNFYGINLQNTNNSVILYNTFEYNKYGNQFDGLNNTVEGNYVYTNKYLTMEGLTFDFYDDYNKIINNEIIGCIRGIVLRLSSHNVISGNIIRDNIYGIMVMGGSEDNLFHENFFIGNNLHVDDGSTTNKWNNTEIGNYWDNYTGIDADYNNIGDMPHIITQTPLIQDYLPIVDGIPPEMTIVSPMNNSVYGLDAPTFNVIIKERYLYKMWYTLDGGQNNYTFNNNGTINQVAWDSLSHGLVTLKFYAIDKIGNLSFKDVIIQKVRDSDSIPGYNIIIFIGISLSFCSLVIKNRNKKRLTIFN